MIRTIRQEVPVYGHPLDTRPGRGLLTGVRRALLQFIELVDDPLAPQEHNAKVFQRLGAGELMEGRTLDSLQAAYRVGARVACRKYMEIAHKASLPSNMSWLLSDAVLTHINLIANESVKGFARAQERSSGQWQRQRSRLAERLLEHGGENAFPATETLAGQASWKLPKHIACVVTEALGQRWELDETQLGEEVLVQPKDDRLFLLIPDPNPSRMDKVREAIKGHPAALGPTVPLADSMMSAYYAKAALRLARRGVTEGETLVRASDHLSSLQLLADEHVAHLLSEQVLDVFAGLPSGKATRLEDTLRALLMSWGRTAPEVATELGIHPQTARHRLRQLEMLLGHRLADPAFRFAAESALRTRLLLHPS